MSEHHVAVSAGQTGKQQTDNAVIQVGDVAFTTERVTATRDGQLVTSMRMDAIKFLELGTGDASDEASRTLLFGGGAILVSIITALNSFAHEPGIGDVGGAVALFLFGVLCIYSGTRTTTVLRVWGTDGRAVMLRVGVKLNAEETRALRIRLRNEMRYPLRGCDEEGYPIGGSTSPPG